MRDDATLAEYDRKLSIRRFPAGRAIQAVRPMEAPARRYGYADLLNLIVVAIAAAMRYIEFKARRSAQTLARGGGMTRVYDAKVDSNFAQMHAVLAREAKDYAAERTGRLAQSMLDACFPKGLAPVTSVPYEEQVALNEYLIAVMRRDHAEAIDELGLERYVSRIEGLLPHFRSSMDASEDVSAVDLGRAYEAMQIGLMRVVGWVMVMEPDADRRAELLAAFHDQESRLAAVHAARRRGVAAGDDVPLDEVELDAEARAALEAEAAAAAAAREAAEAEAAGQAGAGEPGSGDEGARGGDGEPGSGAPDGDGVEGDEGAVDAAPGDAADGSDASGAADGSDASGAGDRPLRPLPRS